jgi:thioesterase domain-containing protein/acyl carrier protein
VACGYLHQDKLTAEKFVPDPFVDEAGARLYRTGDLGRYRADGSIEFIGRLDQQVKIRGFRVELGEIEAALSGHANVKECVVVAREGDPRLGKKLVGYMALRSQGAGSVKEIRQFLKERLPAYMVPARLVPLPALPLNANGKIDRRALPEPDQQAPELGQDLCAPQNPVEEQLAVLWRDVLGLKSVGVQDNFFDLGGHSLLAVRLFAAIEEEFGKKLPLACLFEHPTIQQLARLLREQESSTSWPCIVDIQPQGTRPPIFWIHSLGGDGGGGFFYYRKLAQLLGPDQPSFGIRSPQEPFTRIEPMAAHYVEEIRRIQPQGPYFLGGFCFGGIVAFEVARALQAAGQEIGLLALLESAPPRRPGSSRRWTAQTASALVSNLHSWVRDLLQQRPDELGRRLRRRVHALRAQLRQLFAPGQVVAEDPKLADFIDMTQYPKDYIPYAEAHWQALLAYSPRPYAGQVTLFRARKQRLLNLDPTSGWGDLAASVVVNVIPGTHENMLEEPHVHALASELKTCLIEAQARREDGAPESEEESEAGAGAEFAGQCSIIT